MDSISSTKEHKQKKTTHLSYLGLVALIVLLGALALFLLRLSDFQPTQNFNSDGYVIGNVRLLEG